MRSPAFLAWIDLSEIACRVWNRPSQHSQSLPMPTYWSRFLNPRAEIVTAEQIRAEDDMGALAAAREIAQRGSYAGLEVWDGKRLVWKE
jgi:hypothetical protein